MVAGGATAGMTVERLVVDFLLPGQPGYGTEKQLVELHGTGPDEGAYALPRRFRRGRRGGQSAKVEGDFRVLHSEFPQYRMVCQGNSGSNAFVTDDGRTAYGIVVDEKFTSFDFVPAFRTAMPLLQAQEKATGFGVRTTGYFELSEGNGESSQGGEPPSVLKETLFGGSARSWCCCSCSRPCWPSSRWRAPPCRPCQRSCACSPSAP